MGFATREDQWQSRAHEEGQACGDGADWPEGEDQSVLREVSRTVQQMVSWATVRDVECSRAVTWEQNTAEQIFKCRC